MEKKLVSTVYGQISNFEHTDGEITVIAYEETQTASDTLHPSRLGHPVIRKLGESSLSAAGEFKIHFEPTLPPHSVLVFKASVFVRVCNGTKVVWTSQMQSIKSVIQFNHDLLTVIPDPDPQAVPVITGTLTACGQGAGGLRVTAYERRQFGFPDENGICIINPVAVRTLGSTEIDPNGNFNIHYDPLPEFPEACYFAASVYIKVFDGNLQVWRSETKPETSVVTFDGEIYPGCTVNSTLVRVIDQYGEVTPNAEVYLDGSLKGKTDSQGHLILDDVNPGSSLAARLLLHENRTSRDDHRADSNFNWNYRVYNTSVRIRYDGSGNNVSLRMIVVDDPHEVQLLQLSSRNTLIGFNLLVSIEWDATRQETRYYRDRLLETSELIYNATDGQFLIERLTIVENGTSWNEADIRIYANLNQSSNARVDGFFGSEGQVKMNPYDSFYPGTFLHELGHYIFGARDEYKAGDDWDPDNGPVRCTLKSSDPDSPYSTGAEKDSCLMRGARNECRKKFCSGHALNPHVGGTLQGAVDCWSGIRERFSHWPQWIIQTPTTRGIIVSLFPDSGLPLGTATNAPAHTDQPGSYIPVRSWKPRVHTSGISLPNECPALKVRVMFNGEPLNGVMINLKSTNDRNLYQGKTGRHVFFPDGNSTDTGEIIIRGAHVGNNIRAVKYLGFIRLVIGNHVISENDCEAGFVQMNVFPTGIIHGITDDQNFQKRVSILTDGSASVFRSPAILPATVDRTIEQQITAFDDKGDPQDFFSAVTFTISRPEEPIHAFSSDGQMEVFLPEGAVRTSAQIIIEEITNISVAMPEKQTVLAGPYMISCSGQSDLTRPGIIHMNVGCATVKYGNNSLQDGQLDLMMYNESSGVWQAMQSMVNENPLVVTAPFIKFGKYILVDRIY